MGFYPFLPQTLPLSGGTLTGPLTTPGFTSTAGGTINGGNLGLAGSLNVTLGNVDVSFAGLGLKVAEGSNAKQGTFVLSGAATTVVANTSVTATSRIFLTCQTLGTVTAASTLAVSARSAGTSFTVTPSQATDTSTIAFEIFEPG